LKFSICLLQSIASIAPTHVPEVLRSAGLSRPRCGGTPGPFLPCKSFDLFSIGPVDLRNFGRRPGVSANFFAETFQQRVGESPHFRVLFFFLPAPAEPQPEDSKGPDRGSANLSISTQAAPESAHGPDDFIIFLPQLLLPDRKNGLASMKTLLHHLVRFPQHLFQRHVSLLHRDIVKI
jgi:hypothetical protein